MRRPHVLLGTIGLVAVLLVPASSAQAAPDPLDAPGELQPAAGSYSTPPGAVKPDHAIDNYNNSGARVEIYSSIGDNEGGQDWRPITAYSHLVATVPLKKQLRSTIYNALNDYKTSVYDTTAKQWRLESGSGAVYTPTQAYLDVINQYSGQLDTDGRTPLVKKYVHTLGNKTSINDAVKAPSSLATLVTRATDYKQCEAGSGACLTTRPSGENFMHAKYAAFEQAKDSAGTLRDNVIWITSANLNGASGGKKSNLSIAIYGDKMAYDGLVKLFDLEKQGAKGKAAYFSSQVGLKGIPTSSGITLYPSPRTDSSNLTAVDFEAKVLQETAALGTGKTDCRVYAVHSLFSRNAVRDELGRLDAAGGCDVKVVLGNNAIADVASYYFETSTRLRGLVEKVQFANVHDKTLSVSYTRNGTPVSRTFGGSANFNSTSLQYDELAFRADDTNFARVVQRHSERMYLLAKGADVATPVTSIKLTPANPTIALGQSLNLKATVAPTTASVKTVTWSSSNNAVATVDTAGKVTARGPGTAAIKALTVSGARSTTTAVTVPVVGGTTTSPDNTADAPLKVTTPPELSMAPTQGPADKGGETPVVVTWSQGSVDLSGTVQLQYHTSGSSWKKYKDVSIKNGRVATKYAFRGSHTWRVAGAKVTTRGTSLAKPVYRGFVPNVVRTKDSSATLRLYGPSLIVSKTKVPYIFSWNNPYAGRKGINNNIRLQYYTGRKWVTAQTVAVPSGTFNFDTSWPATNSRKWRIASGLTSQPKGVRAKVSTPVMVYTQ